MRRENPLLLADSAPEPDIAVVRGRSADYAHRHPSTAELVVEVAVTSTREDRHLAAIYPEAGVNEYWIVLAGTRQIEVYRQPVDGVYAQRIVVEPVGTLSCEALQGVVIELDAVFAGLS